MVCWRASGGRAARGTGHRKRKNNLSGTARNGSDPEDVHRVAKVNDIVTVPELSGALIAVFEGCKLSAYMDTGGMWTVGYGHTGSDVDHTTTITQQQAEDFLAQDQAHLFAMVSGKPLLEAAALVSFGYNCGAGALERVMNGQALPGDFVHDHRGNTLPGLVARRKLEETLMLVSQQITAGSNTLKVT